MNVSDAAGNPVADAVVYALPTSGVNEPKPTRTVAIEQVDEVCEALREILAGDDGI